MRVVEGDELAQNLKSASFDKSMRMPYAKYAQELFESKQLEHVCQMLRKRSIKLSNVENMAAVTTVHKAKGFEYDHCAVHSDLLSPEDSQEKNVSFVAFTRHKKSLVVMMPKPA